MKNNYKEKSFEFFYKQLIKKNSRYDFIRHELFYIKKKKFSLLRAFFTLIRDIFILHKYSYQKIDYNEIFFFTLPNNSGLNTFKKLGNFKNHNLIKIPKKNNKKIRCNTLSYNFEIKFFKEFFFNFRNFYKEKNNELLIIILLFRFCFLVTVWQFFFKKINSEKIIINIHNDFDIFNSSLIFYVDYLNKNKKIEVNCFQHGIPTAEFFPTKAKNYYVWSKANKYLFNKNNVLSKRSKIYIYNYINMKKKLLNKDVNRILDNRVFLISQSQTDIYGKKVQKFIINFFQRLLTINENTYCLLHPNENYMSALYLYKKNIIRPPHNFNHNEKTMIFISYCSTAIIEAMLSNHIVIGIDINAQNSINTYNLYSPPIKVKNASQFIKLYKEIKNNNKLINEILNKQKKYLYKLFN